MPDFGGIDDIWAFAIEREEEAATFYDALGESTRRHEMIEFWEDLAATEREHKKTLEFMRGLQFIDRGAPPESDARPLSRFLEHLRRNRPTHHRCETMDTDAAIRFAMHAELSSQNLYAALGQRTGNDRIRETLALLAREEKQHHQRLRVRLAEYEREKEQAESAQSADSKEEAMQ